MVTIREAVSADAPAIARVHVDVWRTTYRGIVPDDYPCTLPYKDRESMWTRVLTATDSQVVFVAEDEHGGIIGFANGGPERSQDTVYAGEIYAIYILDAYHGQGVGRRLMGAVAAWLADKGLIALLVWVATDNPARRFYETLGGTRIHAKWETIGGTKIEEIAYGWTNTCAFRVRLKDTSRGRRRGVWHTPGLCREPV